MLLMILKYILKKLFKKPQVNVEEVVYETDRTYILYSIVQNNFNYCMKNRLLQRRDILEFKFMLNKSINTNDYRHEEFKNDAHEIYRKLKSKSISKKNMLLLNEYLQPFIALDITQPTQEPIRKYGNLVVVK